MQKCLTLFLICVFGFSSRAQDIYLPPNNSSEWETIDPQSLNYCQDSIDALYSFLEEEQTKSFLLLKDGQIILENYFGNFTQDSLWFWFSAGKSLRAVLVGIAQEQEYLDINDKTSDYLGTGWTSLEPEKENLITLWHQLTMTSSLNPVEFTCTDPACLTYLSDAGSFWAYHNSPYNLLKEVLEEATGSTINQLTNNWIKTPIGMDTGIWIPAGDNTFFVSRARDMARFGLLVQNKGQWNGTSVLGDTLYYNQMINTSQELNLSYGYLWWLNGKASFIPPNALLPSAGFLSPDAPADIFTAAGSRGQFISISPETGLMMIRQGFSNDEDNAAIALHNAIWQRIMTLECGLTSTSKLNETPITVFPNPTADIIYIQGLKSDYTVEIFDLTGRLLERYFNPAQLDCTTLEAGLYLFKIQAEKTVYTKRLIKH